MSVLEIHTWGAHADDQERPDFLVFDLDPGDGVKWKAVIACARMLREALGHLKLESYVKTTGGKGLHVCAPIAPRVSWDEAKEFCGALAGLVVRLDPKKYIATMSKARRAGKIFIDFFRNGRGATFIAPYSTRARHGAPVAMPLAWDELSPEIGAESLPFAQRDEAPGQAFRGSVEGRFQQETGALGGGDSRRGPAADPAMIEGGERPARSESQASNPRSFAKMAKERAVGRKT